HAAVRAGRCAVKRDSDAGGGAAPGGGDQDLAGDAAGIGGYVAGPGDPGGARAVEIDGGGRRVGGVHVAVGRGKDDGAGAGLARGVGDGGHDGDDAAVGVERGVVERQADG